MVALLTALAAVWPVKKLAVYSNAIDHPGQRKIHVQDTPKLGGLAIFFGLLAGLGVSVFFYNGVFSRDLIVILSGGLLTVALGFVDDIYALPWSVKLLGQICIAVIVVSCGIEINYLKHPLSLQIIELGIFSKILSVFWILVVMNIINLIDGLDGLAGGIALISAFALFIISLLTNQLYVVFLLIALCGATAGFLRFNFHPASIFLGDTGSLLLGYLLAVCSITGVLKSATVIALGIPLLSLLIPLADTALAIVRRLKNRVNIFLPDSGHLHHILLNYYKHSQREVALLLYSASAVLNLAAVLLSVTSGIYSYLWFLVIIAVLLIVALRLKKRILWPESK
ncbi:MAG: undecaprenyl/decaprenyl-phosphate alpha-N-acetylglucosaminyl 1-phosphate transferase [Candidatus Margulisbacteria bacterium]|nr:undecaprenyl/decaprenyl-phosphate alpha-N-acetylglucosaminyl 1-phosphate transferase [Candidatus Margulisiibacteriota bacterium]